QVELRRRSVLEQVDDAFGLGRELRDTGQAAGARLGVAGKQGRQRRATDARTSKTQKVTPTPVHSLVTASSRLSNRLPTLAYAARSRGSRSALVRASPCAR